MVAGREGISRVHLPGDAWERGGPGTHSCPQGRWVTAGQDRPRGLPLLRTEQPGSGSPPPGAQQGREDPLRGLFLSPFSGARGESGGAPRQQELNERLLPLRGR